MPIIDVSDLLLDGDLTDTFTVIRRLQSVNENGETSVVTSTLNNVLGIVSPTANNELVVQDALQTQGKTLNVVTKFRLRGATQDTTGAQYQPDLIVWNLDTYEIKLLQDFSNYGDGFVSADCASVDLLDEPEADLPIAPVLNEA
jgi:hypothetical protein